MDNIDKNLEISIQVQQKFEFYLLTLVFTILGLSIQTAKLSSYFQGTIEILAWVSLLISGLAGLLRMEWIPVAYKSYSYLPKETEEDIKERTKTMKRIDSQNRIKYLLHKWLFFAGLVLLIISRSLNFYFA